MGFGVAFGGEWVWLAVGYMAVLVALMDKLIAVTTPENPDPGAEFPATAPLLAALGVCHFIVLGGTVWAVAGPSGLAIVERVLLAFTAGLMLGQISHPVAHELIHRSSRVLRLLGRLVYSSMLMGHHASAHLLIHHIHVGSDDDPNSARRGESFYRYARRAARQSFRAALSVETTRRNRAGKPLMGHPFVLYIGVGLAALALAMTTLGLVGGLVLLAIALHGQMQILMSDYVQHYGLRRQLLPNGRLEPVGPHHSWNAPHIFSSALMVNAPRHSDHHVTPNRPFPALQLDDAVMPMLPYSIPVMGVLAMFPRLWRRHMDPLVDHWQSGYSRPATVVDAPRTALDIADVA